MKTTLQQTETQVEKQGSIKLVMNLIGLLIFGGTALTALTNAAYQSTTFKFYLSLVGGAAVYYLLIYVFFLEQGWRKVFFIILFSLGCASIGMVFYLAINGPLH
ncbi:hypothetical protein FIU87_04795 [Bacillus sp. THAF10]|uniref:hypothetical protein n=1 Tax=Bacillus sp. THAF10 TaxID=2587848 RepID=UPI0012694B2C|nr:hypothetical protein [Bacillus sp. THAF10]QFT87967.1 hypothetical protein FIU87_04795 [Bacillus sp. THAF10]